jgi:hypothetical protein
MISSTILDKPRKRQHTIGCIPLPKPAKSADPKDGAVESGVWLFAQPTCHRAPEVHSAVGETEATGLLREFFRATR